MIRSIAAGALFAFLTLVAAPADASATDDVRAAMLKFAALRSYEMTFGSGARTATADFVNPDSMHMSSQGMELIHIGTTTYMKMGGKWQKLPSSRGETPMGMADRVRKMASKANGVTATDLGMKSVGGETLHAYKMTQSDGTTGTCYIGRDGLPHRLQGKSADETVVISKFNAVAPIHAPL
ncbi:MAG TPA: hypothetical protein VGD01_01625 [Candidatus Elarobacter sp.]